jgi:hypothetical protein
MATPAEKLAASLEALHVFQEQGKTAIRSSALSRIHRERLTSQGFLREVIRGWYIPSRPDEPTGESTSWYASFWHFCAEYLDHRFGTNWCLSPEQSLSLHAENWSVPRQLMVRSPKSGNKSTDLLHGTSLFELRSAVANDADIASKNGLRLFTVPAALVACSSVFFQQNPTDAATAMATIRNASELLNKLLDGGHSVVAGRLVGAFRHIGRERIADDILKAMRSAGYVVREQNPFDTSARVTLNARTTSPYVTRIRLMWEQMRGPILDRFPPAPGIPNDTATYLARVQENYVTDAYHSLSIEGYRVGRELIEKVRRGEWNPDNEVRDREHKDAMAARGYWEAYQAVRQSLTRILANENSGQVVDEDHGDWYRALFAPSVTTGLLKPADLAGYRNGQVYIRNAQHVPLSPAGVRDAMPAFLELLSEEPEPSVRIVLGHFIFVYIHPYMDGNGRMGRFLMNTMLASGGYPWTVVPVEDRPTYMATLDAASAAQNIAPFTDYLAKLVEATMAGHPTASAP